MHSGNVEIEVEIPKSWTFVLKNHYPTSQSLLVNLLLKGKKPEIAFVTLARVFGLGLAFI